MEAGTKPTSHHLFRGLAVISVTFACLLVSGRAEVIGIGDWFCLIGGGERAMCSWSFFVVGVVGEYSRGFEN